MRRTTIPVSTGRNTLLALVVAVLCAACGDAARDMTAPDGAPSRVLNVSGDPVGGGGGGGTSGSTGCLAGYYEKNPGVCFGADPGHYVPAPNATAQLACDLGYYQPNDTQTSCLAADLDNYVDQTGSTSETQCPAPMTTYDIASTSISRRASSSAPRCGTSSGSRRRTC